MEVISNSDKVVVVYSKEEFELIQLAVSNLTSFFSRSAPSWSKEEEFLLKLLASKETEIDQILIKFRNAYPQKSLSEVESWLNSHYGSKEESLPTISIPNRETPIVGKGSPWSEDEVNLLKSLAEEASTIKVLAENFRALYPYRTELAIQAKVDSLKEKGILPSEKKTKKSGKK